MSKIVCDVCGTRYPDTVEQCPICGHIRDASGRAAEDAMIMDDVLAESRPKVRGGRFSKSNVKKRTEGASRYADLPEEEPKPVKKERTVREPRQAVKEKPVKETKAAKKAAPAKPVQKDEDIFAEDNQNKKANTVLNVLLIIVILALLAVTAYIFTQHVLPGMRKPEPTTAPTASAVTEPTAPPVTEEPAYPCDELLLEETDVKLVEYGEKWLINVDVRPANTTDVLTFTSSDEQIATVDSEGCITAMAEGECVITITCGNVSAKYNVLCYFPYEDIPPGWEPTEPPPTEPPEEWTVVSKTVVNVRNGPAKEYDRVRQCKNGDKVYVYEIRDVRGTPWGRLEDGWICLSYAKKSE